MAKKASRLGKPTPLAGGKAMKVSLYLNVEEWEILERIGRVTSPGIEPSFSEVVRLAIREAGKLKRFQEEKG